MSVIDLYALVVVGSISLFVVVLDSDSFFSLRSVGCYSDFGRRTYFCLAVKKIIRVSLRTEGTTAFLLLYECWTVIIFLYRGRSGVVSATSDGLPGSFSARSNFETRLRP